MRTSIVFLIFLFRGLAILAQTPSQLAASAAQFQSLSDRQLQIIDAFLLAGIAGASLSPSSLASSAAAFQGVSDRDLQVIQTYLLSQLANGSGSIMEGLTATHVGTTISQQAKFSNINPMLYVASGEGMMKSIEFTSDIEADLDNRTNRTIRIYTDAGAIPNYSNAPAGNLVAEIPMYSVMDCRYWPNFRTNNLGPITFGTRYVGWTEVSVQNAFQSGVSHYTVTLRYPCPYTNGILVILWDTPSAKPVNHGFSYVNYEVGTVPTPYRQIRLRTYHSITNMSGSQSNIPVLIWNGPGEVSSLFISPISTSVSANLYWDGVWLQTPDGATSTTAFGCAGGEDMFNNGHFFDSGAQSQWDWGTRYLHGPTGSDNYVVEAYRHFYGADTHRWYTNQNIFFNIGVGFTDVTWDSLAIFYGQ